MLLFTYSNIQCCCYNGPLWVGWCHSKRYVQVLSPGTCECDLMWKYGICRYNETSWDEIFLDLGWALNPVIMSLLKKGEGYLRCIEENHVETEAEIRGYNYCQETSRTACSRQKLGGGHESDYSSDPSEGAFPAYISISYIYFLERWDNKFSL